MIRTLQECGPRWLGLFAGHGAHSASACCALFAEAEFRYCGQPGHHARTCPLNRQGTAAAAGPSRLLQQMMLQHSITHTTAVSVGQQAHTHTHAPHTHTHAHTHTNTNACKYSQTQARTYTCTRTNTQTHRLAHIQTPKHTGTHTHTCICMHTLRA